MAIYMNMVKPNHFIFAKYFRAANTLVVINIIYPLSINFRSSYFLYFGVVPT